jgi:hypothetical protein
MIAAPTNIESGLVISSWELLTCSGYFCLVLNESFPGDNREAGDVETKQNGQFSKLYSAIYAYVIDEKEKGVFFFKF